MRKKVKLITGLILILIWIIIIFGIVPTPNFIWALMLIITFLFYIVAIGPTFRRRKSTRDVINDMEDYMERKTDEQFGSNEEKEADEEHDFEDDIKIIKK